MRQLAVGDIHGGYRALMQCLKRSKFDYENDELVIMGDTCDGWPETKQVINEFLKMKHTVLIMGNHDQWMIDWANCHFPGSDWTSQGGMNTLKSYGGLDPDNFPKEHMEFFKRGNWWFYDGDYGRLFVHGGLDWNKPIEDQTISQILWDRELIRRAVQNQIIADNSGLVPKPLGRYKEIFVGHTTTTCLAPDKGTLPVHACNVWDIDTGGGYEGKLTIMDTNTKEYWQSDFVFDLYPEEEHGRVLRRIKKSAGGIYYSEKYGV